MDAIEDIVHPIWPEYVVGEGGQVQLNPAFVEWQLQQDIEEGVFLEAEVAAAG